jgi:hypothetical protein
MRSKFLFLLLSSCIISLASAAQGLINNGAFIVMNGASSNIYIDGANGNYTNLSNGLISPLVSGPTITLLGNWVNNSFNGGFYADGSTVVFAGANQSINGTFTPNFDNVRLMGSGTKTLNTTTAMCGMGGVPIGVLSLGTRPLDLNGYDLWITNPGAGAITTTTGYIQSETNVALNPSRVNWIVGTSTGARVIPFGVAASQIPLTVNITTGMSNSSHYFAVATRATSTSANTPWASGVTHMYDPTLLQDGSDEAVIDRWWEFTFASAATADVTFSYRGSENTLQIPYNAGNIGAQWWAGGWIPDNSTVGSNLAVLAGVGNVTAPGLSFGASVYTPMVLSSVNAPLPVELVSFNANCNDDKELLTWTTASELNNDFFTVERSDDGTSFRDIGTVNGSGTTIQSHSYSFTDPQAVSAAVYYRLRQTDYNGHTTRSSLIVAEKCGTNSDYIDAFSSGAAVTILLNTSAETTYKAELYDAQGKLVVAQTLVSEAGTNRFTLDDKIPATGIYMLSIVGSDGKVFAKKLYVIAE